MSLTKAGIVRTLAVATALAAAMAAGDASAQKVLRYVPQANMGTMDPVNNLSSVTHQHSWRVYDNLFGEDTAGNVHPQMVESFTLSPDGLTYTIKLRAGIKFHDGTPVRSQDVIPSIQRWAKLDGGGKRLAALDMKLTAVDQSTFTLTLREPFPATPGVLAYGSTAMYVMREKEATTDANTPITEVVGSGPFVFNKAEYQPGNKLVYDKNKDYMPRSEPVSAFSGGRVAKVDRIDVMIIPDANTAIAALNTGEIDMYETPPLDLLPVLRRNPNVKVVVFNKAGALAFVRPNHIHPPFNNPKARQALMHMVDQEDYLRAAIGSDPANWKVCWAIQVCGTPTASEAGSEPYRKADLAKARQLLQESGYKGEKIVVLIPMDQQVIRDLAQVTVEKLKSIGANVEPVATDWGSALTRGNNKAAPEAGGWHLFHTWTVGQILGSAISAVHLTSPCDQTGYRGWACDPKMEEYMAEWIKVGTTEKRKPVGEKIQRQGMEMVQFVPLGQFFQPMAMRTNINGLQETLLPVFWNIEKN